MMSKVLIALLPLLALSTAQIPDWEYTQELDDVNASYLLYWVYQPEAKDIVIQMKAARGTGWIYFGIDNPEGTLTDVIIGGYNNTNGLPYVFDMSSTIDASGAHGALIVDPSPDVVLQRGFEYPPETVLRVKRSINTADSADVVIVPGPMSVSWAYSDSDDINAPLIAGGTATVTFIPL